MAKNAFDLPQRETYLALRDRRRVPNVVIRTTTATRTDVTPVVMDATGVTKLTMASVRLMPKTSAEQ